MRKLQFSEGEYYHLYNRGVDRRTIFTSSAEYERFLRYLYVLNDEDIQRETYAFKVDKIDEAKPRKKLVAIGAYCLMPNHFHLYVTPLVEGGVSKFMQRVSTAYTMFFNERHERSGALFQGTFKAEHVTTDRYARYFFSYIHLNPAKLRDPKWKERGVHDLQAMREFLHSYPYSSMKEYLTGAHLLTQPRYFPEYLKTEIDILEHLDDWLTSKGEFVRLSLPTDLSAR